jgi:carbon monoxide dehydrogenase subunit G
MKFAEDRVLPVTPEVAWAALNDDGVLQRCIPGCESLARETPEVLKATVALAIGPVKARFNGTVRFENIQPMKGYTLVFEGQGGIAGFSKGTAAVQLGDGSDGTTVLTYEAQAQVGGKIAQLGSRLIEATSKKLAGEFFSRFEQELAAFRPVAKHAAPATPRDAVVRGFSACLRSCWDRLTGMGARSRKGRTRTPPP